MSGCSGCCLVTFQCARRGYSRSAVVNVTVVVVVSLLSSVLDVTAAVLMSVVVVVLDTQWL